MRKKENKSKNILKEKLKDKNFTKMLLKKILNEDGELFKELAKH